MLRRRDPVENEIPPPAGVTARCVGRWRSSRFRRRLAAGPWDVLRAPATLRPVAFGCDPRSTPPDPGCQWSESENDTARACGGASAPLTPPGASEALPRPSLLQVGVV